MSQVVGVSFVLPYFLHVVAMIHGSSIPIGAALRSVGCLLAVISTLMSATSAMATCGDYLLDRHDRAEHERVIGSQDWQSAQHLFGEADDRHPLPMKNHRTGCENGRCQQSPLAPPLPEVPRISLSQRFDLIANSRLIFFPLGRDTWRRAVDSPLPEALYFDVASPPPESV